MKSEIPFSGRLEDRFFPEIAAALYRLGKSGELTLSTPTGNRRVYFLDGNPVAVISGDPADRLVEFLLKSGKISPDEAKRLEKVPETRQALQVVDFVPEEVLAWGLKFRFVELCYDLFRWTTGDYRFHERPAPADLILLKVQTPTLVIKGAPCLPGNILDSRIPRHAMIRTGELSLTEAPFLRPEETKFLTEALRLKNVDEALKAHPMEKDRFHRLLFAFSVLGLVTIISQTPEMVETEEPLKTTGKTVAEPSRKPAPSPKKVQEESLPAVSPTAPVFSPSPPKTKPPALPHQEKLPYRGEGQSVKPPRRRIFFPLQRRLVVLVGIGVGVILVIGLWKFVSVMTSPMVSEESTTMTEATPTPRPEMVPPTAGIPTSLPPAPAVDSYEEGLTLYRAGNIREAAIQWISMLREEFSDSFTIQIEIACEARTVEEDFRKWGEDKKMFLTPINYQGRDCYRVFAGLFSSRQEAVEALEALPVEIRVQGAAIKAVEAIL